MELITAHDKKVKRIAAGLLGQGWKVKAPVLGYTRPKQIRGRIPDVFATKGKSTRIIEVETPQTFKTHKDQRDILRDFVKGRRRTKFKVTRVLE